MTPRTDAAQQVAELLRTAQRALGLSVAFLSRMDGDTQHLEVVESSGPCPVTDGSTQPRVTSFCQAVAEGRFPAVIPDVGALPGAMELPAAQLLGVRSFVSVPVVLSDGTAYGTFCAAGTTPDSTLSDRDLVLMEVLASAAALVVEPGVRAEDRRAVIDSRLQSVVTAGGPVVLLQPVVDLATGERVGAEALSRFPASWELPPDACFAQAHSIGRGHELELLALRRAGELLDRVPGYVAMNVSPATLLSDGCTGLLARLPLHRVVLELSEHDAVADYGLLGAALAPLREAGMRLAVDDVGAGFSSLRHVLLTRPDVVKIDRSIVSGVHTDPVLAVLVRSLTDVGHGCAAVVVAEGVETAGEAAVLRTLGVDQGQGWFFGRPGPAEALQPVARGRTAV